MDITWHGQSCFTIKGKKGTVVTNPFADEIKNEKLKADLVLVTEMPTEKGSRKLAQVAGEPKIFDVPGEYEVSEIPVVGTQVPGEKDEKPLKKTIFQFRIDDLSVCHLGNLTQTLPAEMIEKIGDVDILIVPVGGIDCLDAKKAHEIIEEIEPRVVVPMCYEDATIFLKTTGTTPETKDVYSIAKKADLPQDRTEYVMLNVK